MAIDANTVFLLESDTDEGSITFIDSSEYKHKCSRINSSTAPDNQCKHTQSDQQFGLSSVFFRGLWDYLYIPSDSKFSFLTGNFTIDFWVKMDSNCDDNGPIMWWSYGNLTIRKKSGEQKLECYIRSSQVETTINYDTWTHIALVRNSGVVRLYKGGVQQDSVSEGGSIVASSIYLGRHRTGSWPFYTYYWFKGEIDEFRISDKAQWTSNFTPSSESYVTTVPTETGYGIQVVNNKSKVVIDGKYRNFAFKRFYDVSVYAGTNVISIENTDRIGMPAFQLRTDCYLSWLGLVKSGSQYTHVRVASSAARTIRFAWFEEGEAEPFGTGAQYGLEVENEWGQPVYISTDRSLDVINRINIAGSNNGWMSGDPIQKPVVNADDYYYVVPGIVFRHWRQHEEYDCTCNPIDDPNCWANYFWPCADGVVDCIDENIDKRWYSLGIRKANSLTIEAWWAEYKNEIKNYRTCPTHVFGGIFGSAQCCQVKDSGPDVSWTYDDWEYPNEGSFNILEVRLI